MAKELYVGNLPYDVDEGELRRIFAVAGTVTSVHIIVDAQTGASKGCAYVRMGSEDDIKDAIESLDGALIGGRLITVSVARPFQERKGAPGGRRGGTGGRRPGKSR